MAYFFGMIQGPFLLDENDGYAPKNLLETIKTNIQQKNPNLTISSFQVIKLGVHLFRKFDLKIKNEIDEENSPYYTDENNDENPDNINEPLKILSHEQIYFYIKNKNEETSIFQIGKTGMLEFEDIKIQYDSSDNPNSIAQIYFNRAMDDNTYINYVIKTT